MLAEIDRVEAAAGTPFGANALLGERTRRVFNPLGRDAGFGRVPLFAPVLGLAERVLVEGLLLSSLTAIDMHPGQGAQPFHADDGSIPLPRPHVPLTGVAIWALTDFTPRNGATRLVPGSHRAERRARPGERPDEVVEAVMPAGSVLVYNGSLWHGGGPNRSDALRRGIACNYCAGWVRQEGASRWPCPATRWRTSAPAAPDGGLRRVQGPDRPRRPGRPRHVVRRRRHRRHDLGPHALRGRAEWGVRRSPRVRDLAGDHLLTSEASRELRDGSPRRGACSRPR